MPLAEEHLDGLAGRVPDAPKRPLHGGPAADKHNVVRETFCVLDHGAKPNDLSLRTQSKSTVHRWFQLLARDGVFERIMRETGRCVEARRACRPYECCNDGTFSRARSGDGPGCTETERAVRIMVSADARALPVAVDMAWATPYEKRLVLHMFSFMLTEMTPQRVIGNSAYDSDRLDEERAHQRIAMMAPHHGNRKIKNFTQEGRLPRRYDRRWTTDRTISRFQNFHRRCIRGEKSTQLFGEFLHLG